MLNHHGEGQGCSGYKELPCTEKILLPWDTNKMQNTLSEKSGRAFYSVRPKSRSAETFKIPGRTFNRMPEIGRCCRDGIFIVTKSLTK